MEIVSINGEPWQKRPPKAKKRTAGTISTFLTTGAVLGAGLPNLDGHAESSPIDLATEYALIQLKTSKLSSNKRKYVVWQFERTYKKQENEQE